MTTEPVRIVAAGWLPPNFTPSAFDRRVQIETAHTDEELRVAARSADILYSWQVPEIVPAQTPHLQWIQLPSAGADHVRGLPVWESDIVLTASQGIHTVPMSEHLFAMVLGLARHIPQLVRAQDNREWHRPRGAPVRFTELHGKTMGIVGWGKIGDGVAHLARAFGMRVIGTRWTVLVPREVPSGSIRAYSDPPWLEPVDTPPDIVFPPAQLHEVLAQSDVVVLILPLTDETRGCFGEDEFRAMKRDALFFNIGRGAVVNEGALVHALQSGLIAGAGLDVMAQEPLPRSSPLWSMPNVIISPHVGGVSEQTRERAAWFFAVNLTRYLEGQELLNVVNRSEGY